MRKILLVLIPLLILILSVIANADDGEGKYDRKIDPDIGSFLECIKTLPDGSDIYLYKRSWIEAITPEQARESNDYDAKRHDLFSLTLKKSNPKSYEIIFQMGYISPWHKDEELSRGIPMNILDVQLAGNDGILLFSPSQDNLIVHVIKFKWGDGVVSGRCDYPTIYHTDSVYNRLVSARILSDRRFLFTFEDRMERWMIVDSNDIDSRYGKKAVRVWTDAKKKIDTDIGKLVKYLKTEDGQHVDVYKRSWTEIRNDDQLNDPKLAGEWNVDMYSLVAKDANTQSTKIVYQMDFAYPLDEKITYPRAKDIEFMDIGLNKYRNAVLYRYGSVLEVNEYELADGVVKYKDCYVVGPVDEQIIYAKMHWIDQSIIVKTTKTIDVYKPTLRKGKYAPK